MREKLEKVADQWQVDNDDLVSHSFLLLPEPFWTSSADHM